MSGGPRAKSPSGDNNFVTVQRARASLAPTFGATQPGAPFQFVLSTPGVKRDGINLASKPFLLDRYHSNPVVLANHNHDALPIGRGAISVVQTRSGEALVADVWFDLDDPLGALADSKIRNGFLHAVSIGWVDVDSAGVPAQISGRKVAGHEILEFSVVSVPADPDALVVVGGREYRCRFVDVGSLAADDGDVSQGEILFLEEAVGLDTDDGRRENLARALQALGVCSGDDCRVIANGIAGTVGDNDVRMVAEQDTSDEEDSGIEADDAVKAEAEIAAAKAAMVAAIWVDPGQDVDERSRKQARDAVLPRYRRLGLVPPVMLPSAVCATLPYERQAALFVNGEVDMANIPAGEAGGGARKGAKIAGSRLAQLEQARTKIEDGLKALSGVISDAADAERSGERCGCASKQVAQPAIELTQEEQALLDEVKVVFPGARVVPGQNGARAVMIDLFEVSESEDVDYESAMGGKLTLDPAFVESLAAQIAQALGGSEVTGGYMTAPSYGPDDSMAGTGRLTISIDVPDGIDAEAYKAAVLAALTSGSPQEVTAPEPAPEPAPGAEPAPEAAPAEGEVAPTGEASFDPEPTDTNEAADDVLARLKALLG